MRGSTTLLHWCQWFSNNQVFSWSSQILTSKQSNTVKEYVFHNIYLDIVRNIFLNNKMHFLRKNTWNTLSGNKIIFCIGKIPGAHYVKNFIILLFCIFCIFLKNMDKSLTNQILYINYRFITWVDGKWMRVSSREFGW